MKNIIKAVFLALVVLLKTSCSETESEKPKLVNGQKYHFQKIEVADNEETFPTYRISDTDIPTELDFAYQKKAVARLAELNPIVIADANSRIGLQDQNEAISKYKAFLHKYREDTVMIRHFRGQYANRLLLDYKVIQSQDTEKLLFFVKELVHSETGRFGTILAGLDRLSKMGDSKSYIGLVLETQRQVEVSLRMTKAIQRRLPDLIRKLKEREIQSQGTLREDFTIASLEKEDFSKKISKLERYRNQVIKMKT
ncbi:hypothetical protein [Dyadobacter sp. CY323]|uniref:hypothetical protein n=1 Tax=Dyadobacter sp. CY323 TaxID=2907302 RepID=UPI001F236376|nr:hypothetical protein [Dyadobacter sp. CY323]MCE6990457.1 hypothetical protein [Dyadobacter sp. CY323]